MYIDLKLRRKHAFQTFMILVFQTQGVQKIYESDRNCDLSPNVLYK